MPCRRCTARARLAFCGLLAICGALSLGGCGGSGTARHSSGRALFAEDCSGCHSLSGIESPKRQGGDLLGVHLSPAITLQFTREMPVPRRLNQAELTAVADYVVAVERRGR